MSRLLRGLLFSIVAGVALYGLIAAASGDVGKVSESLLRFPGRLLAAGAFLASLNYAFRFIRWQYYLKLLSIPVPALSSLLIFLSGFALTVTPGKVGEVLKSYLLKQAYGVPIVRTAPIVIVERVTDLLALLVLAVLGVLSWMAPRDRWIVALGFGLCAAMVLALSWRRLGHLLIDLVVRLPPARVFGRLAPKLRMFYDTTALLSRPGPLLYCTLLAIFSWSCECVAFYVILGGFRGVEASLLLCTFIYAMMTVAGALAFMPGGLGVTEGGMAMLVVRLARGASASVAVAATLIIRVLTLWFAVLLGLAALLLVQRVQHLRVGEFWTDQGEGPTPG